MATRRPSNDPIGDSMPTAVMPGAATSTRSGTTRNPGSRSDDRHGPRRVRPTLGRSPSRRRALRRQVQSLERGGAARRARGCGYADVLVRRVGQVGNFRRVEGGAQGGTRSVEQRSDDAALAGRDPAQACRSCRGRGSRSSRRIAAVWAVGSATPRHERQQPLQEAVTSLAAGVLERRCSAAARAPTSTRRTSTGSPAPAAAAATVAPSCAEVGRRAWSRCATVRRQPRSGASAAAVEERRGSGPPETARTMLEPSAMPSRAAPRASDSTIGVSALPTGGGLEFIGAVVPPVLVAGHGPSPFRRMW